MNAVGLEKGNLAAAYEFLKQSLLLKLNVYDSERENWRQKALEVLDDHQMSENVGEGDEAASIFFNETQGRKFTFGLENDPSTHDIMLFIVSKQTHFFGKLLAPERLNCDFAMLKFEAPMSMVKMEQLKQEELELAKTREVKL